MYKLGFEEAGEPEMKLPIFNGCWKFDLWFCCLFEIQLVHLVVLSSHAANVLLEGFSHYFAKGFDSVNHNKLWKILKELGIPDHLTCLLRNL